MDKAVVSDRFAFVTVSSIDGKLGLNGGEGDIEQGGLFGLTKSLKFEWPKAFCKAIDLAPELNVKESLEIILEELQDADQSIVEIGRPSKGERMTLEAYNIPASNNAPVVNAPSKESVFLVSGGARGITADCVIDLAKAYKSSFILLGRTDISGEEPLWAKSKDGNDLKMAALNELKKALKQEQLQLQ